jgi:hypothetical protein
MIVALAAICLAFHPRPEAADSKPLFESSILFPEEPHAWCRIPSIVVSKNGVVLAFAERRIGSVDDYGHDSESVLRRSFDNRSWVAEGNR